MRKKLSDLTAVELLTAEMQLLAIAAYGFEHADETGSTTFRDSARAIMEYAHTLAALRRDTYGEVQS